jgi:hypothetical protein
MAAVAFYGMRGYAAVRLSPLVVVRWAVEGGEYIDGDGFYSIRYQYDMMKNN